MRKLFLLIFTLISFLNFAQNRQITFESGNVASVFERAKKENKLIFVDAYTSWCGPCKWMAKNIFTNDTVADYFNTNFVNYKLDMEKGEGPEFAKKYNVSCYPNLLFIDANGNLVHRVAGAMPAAAFIDVAKAGQSTDRNFTSIRSKYEKDGINESNIVAYVQLLSGTCLDASVPVTNYLKTVKEEDLLKRTNWVLMRDYVYDHNSREMKYFLANTHAFENKYGKDTVEEKISQLGESYFMKYIRAKEYDKAGFENAKKEFTALNWPNSKKALFDANLGVYKRFDKPKYYDLASAEFYNYYVNDANALNSVAWDFYENATDKTHLQAACKMAERACELRNSYAHFDTYAAVLYKSGKKKEAEVMANRAIEQAKAENLGPDDYKETSELLNKIKGKK